MLNYSLHSDVECSSTNIGDPVAADLVVPIHQSHGIRSVVLDCAADAAHTIDTDALITCRPGLRIGVKTADCVPILLFDPVSRAIAAVHSGWKGTLAGIAAHTIRHMAEACGADPGRMLALIGPCIHQEAFEVGDEVRLAFSEAGYDAFCALMPRFGTSDHVKWHIDLPGACRWQLQQAGVGSISVRDECTYTLHRTFYSARRLGPAFAAQRIYTSIMLKP